MTLSTTALDFQFYSRLARLLLGLLYLWKQLLSILQQISISLLNSSEVNGIPFSFNSIVDQPSSILLMRLKKKYELLSILQQISKLSPSLYTVHDPVTFQFYSRLAAIVREYEKLWKERIFQFYSRLACVLDIALD